MDDQTLICYVLMRTDLRSMNPGKAMAQAHHCYGTLMTAAHACAGDWAQPFIEWQRTTNQNFGTVIVLEASENEIEYALETAKRIDAVVLTGWVLDDTYPIRDGDVTHLIPLHTCAFVFGTKADCADVVGEFELHE